MIIRQRSHVVKLGKIQSTLDTNLKIFVGKQN